MSISAAAWSAIAAMLSAIAAFLLWRTEQRSFQHSARPEIVITGWRRNAPDKLTFEAIENVGHGSALHVHMNAFSLADDNRPMVVMSTIRESLISPNGRTGVMGEISIWWNNVAGPPGSKHVPVNIEIYCWDTTGVRYKTKYNLLVVELGRNIGVADQIAPGVMLGTRSVICISSNPI